MHLLKFMGTFVEGDEHFHMMSIYKVICVSRIKDRSCLLKIMVFLKWLAPYVEMVTIQNEQCL